MSSSHSDEERGEARELEDLEAAATSSSEAEEDDAGISPAYNDEKMKGKKKRKSKGESSEEEEEDGSDDEVDGSSGSRDAITQSDVGLRAGTAAKHIPVTLAFKNLFFSVKVRKGKNPFQKKHKKTLLKDLHGELRPGEVTAIMGPSGTPLKLSYPFTFFHHV
jgi:ABC-type glutathione transport system ATPase component